MSDATSKRRRALGLAAAAALVVSLPGCGDSTPRTRTNERWVTTQDTTVELDWDAVAKAYREAEGPEDLERRVNEIYTGDEIISVAVHDVDAKTQEVTGFFDRNTDGTVADDEKVFTIQRTITGPESGQMRATGYGRYAGYRSPVWDIATGMLLGSMISRAFSPSYIPAYTQKPYVTPSARRGELTTHRDSYRQQNPDKFRQGKQSQSGRSYGSKGSSFGGGRPSSSSPSSSSPSSSSRSSSPSSSSRSVGGGRFGRRLEPRGSVLRLEA